MSALQWMVIGMVISSFFGMVAAFVVVALKEEAEVLPQGDMDFPPLDYTQHQEGVTSW